MTAGREADPGLLDALPDLAGERVLILGVAGGLAAELSDRGCRRVTQLAPGGPPHWRDADVVVVASAQDVLSAVAQARHALVPSGRVLLRTASDLAETAARALRLHGFSAIRVNRAGERVLVTAELPIFGRVVAA